MSYDLESGAKRVIANLRELASLTSDENGAQRVAWSPAWLVARNWYSKKAQAAGALVSIDAAGNLWAKIQGKSDEAVVIGSHLDSVPNGGWLDGALGVVVTLEILQRYGVGEQWPEKTIYAVDWVDEEARFGRSLIGSSAASGTLDVKEIINLVDGDGCHIKEVLAGCDVDINHLHDAHEQFKQKNISASLELHIEQGPVLESKSQDVACVYGVTGVERHWVKFKGQAAHAGSFPTAMRQDAFLSAAAAALGFREIALKYNAVCTVGKVAVHPDVITIVPDSCTISLDQRAIDKAILAKMLAAAQKVAKDAAKFHGTTVEWEKIWSIAPTLFDEKLVALCKQAVKDELQDDTAIYSGPLHDSAEMAKLVPSVMMFAMSERGLSHCKEENTSDTSLATAIRAFLRLVHAVLR